MECESLFRKGFGPYEIDSYIQDVNLERITNLHLLGLKIQLL